MNSVKVDKDKVWNSYDIVLVRLLNKTWNMLDRGAVESTSFNE